MAKAKLEADRAEISAAAARAAEALAAQSVAPIYTPARDTMPAEITNAEAIALFVKMGLAEDVKALLDDPECPAALRLLWSKPGKFRRDDPLYGVLEASGLGLDKVDVLYAAIAAEVRA